MRDADGLGGGNTSGNNSGGGNGSGPSSSIKDQCLAQYYNSAAGKATDFGGNRETGDRRDVSHDLTPI